MGQKFNRNYRLRIGVSDNQTSNFIGQSPDAEGPFLAPEILIEYPLTIEFNVDRGIGASLNSLQCTVVNLSPETRSRIFQDRFGYFSAGNNEGAYRRVTLEAGYGDNLTIVFQGNLFEAGSYRRGTEIITIINARDGGYDTAVTRAYQTYKVSTLQELIQQLCGGFPNLKVGQIGNFPDQIKRPVSVDGNQWDALQMYSSGSAYIDNEVINVLGDTEVIQNSIQIIDPSTGLLETPQRDDAALFIRTLFEPNIIMGQYLQLDSKVQPVYNGTYKVISVGHHGIISGAKNGPYESRFGLLLQGKLFGSNTTVDSNLRRVDLSTPPVSGN